MVFTIIMTTRQMLSMLISTVAFGHSIGGVSVIGVILVFGTVINKIRGDYKKSTSK